MSEGSLILLYQELTESGERLARSVTFFILSDLDEELIGQTFVGVSEIRAVPLRRRGAGVDGSDE